jgi:tRNA U34 2-thiouridine synthase MnmA/TrmU
MTKNYLSQVAKSKGLVTSYSGSTKTLFVKGNGSEEFVKKYTPDKTGNIRNDKGHFIKGGLRFRVCLS